MINIKFHAKFNVKSLMLRHEFNGIYLINISYINESYIKYILDAYDNERN